MKIYFKVLLVVVGIITFLSFDTCAYTINDKKIGSEVTIENELKAYISNNNIPGVVLSYGFGAEPVHTIAAGYSKLSTATAMKNDNVFLSGSITKSFLAAMILQLVEKNDLSLDDTLQDISKRYNGILKAIITKYPSMANITLKELLNHTSGVPEAINTDKFRNAFVNDPCKFWSDESLIDLAMTNHPSLYFPPGEKGKWSYTNTDYILLGIVLQDVSKMSLNENFTKLFNNLKIKNLYYADNGLMPINALNALASGFTSIDDNKIMNRAFTKLPVVTIPGKDKIQSHEITSDYNIFSPSASGLVATAPALLKWYRALFQGNLLKKTSINEMLNVIHNGKYNEAGYGLGVTSHVMPKYGYVISHDGLEPGYSVIVMYFVKYNLFIAIATNSSNTDVSTFNVYDGQSINGIIDRILPLILQSK
jgi:D-alanyl-D-alanine carboxypeptidase